MILTELLSEFVKHFPQDAWSAEVAMVYVDNSGNRQIDAIRAVAMIPVKNTFVIAIVSESEIERVKKATGGLPERGEHTHYEYPCDYSI